MRRTIYISLAVLVVLLLGAYILMHPTSFAVNQVPNGSLTNGIDAALSTSSSQQVEPLGPHRDPPAGQKEYYSEHYLFSLFYPDTLSVKEYTEGGGSMTITFQNVKTAQGFQIYVLPYNATQVSAEQFRRDEPSGLRQSAKDITIGGETAMSFFSTNAVLGDTAEIWFIHNGYLYEVTTLKPLAGWLSGIMLTWQFI